MAVVDLARKRAARDEMAKDQAIRALAAAIAALPPSTLRRLTRLAADGTLADALRREFQEEAS